MGKLRHTELSGLAKVTVDKWPDRDLNPSLLDSWDSALRSIPYLVMPSGPTLSPGAASVSVPFFLAPPGEGVGGQQVPKVSSRFCLVPSLGDHLGRQPIKSKSISKLLPCFSDFSQEAHILGRPT